jgi:hypothetical protein
MGAGILGHQCLNITATRLSFICRAPPPNARSPRFQRKQHSPQRPPLIAPNVFLFAHGAAFLGTRRVLRSAHEDEDATCAIKSALLSCTTHSPRGVRLAGRALTISGPAVEFALPVPNHEGVCHVAQRLPSPLMSCHVGRWRLKALEPPSSTLYSRSPQGRRIFFSLPELSTVLRGAAWSHGRIMKSSVNGSGILPVRIAPVNAALTNSHRDSEPHQVSLCVTHGALKDHTDALPPAR